MEWTQEEIDDDEVHITCEGVQTVCQSILSTVTELLADDMDEQNIHSSEDESKDAHNQSYFLI
jgi:hypothetical protein